jgi:DNA-binding response OmpR family regulator
MIRRAILYAEDDENDAFLTEGAFKKAEVQNPLVVVPDGKVAMEYVAAAGEDPKHLVLLDLKMPGISKLEVLEWIRSQKNVCTLPVLMLTSSNQESDIYRAYALGANAYLIKPSKTNEMLAMAKGIRDFWLS